MNNTVNRSYSKQWCGKLITVVTVKTLTKATW